MIAIADIRAARTPAARMRLLLAMMVVMNCAYGYEPQANYMLNCMGCHVEDGSGAPGKVPSLRSTLIPFAQSPAGRRYLVQVPGTSQSMLTDGEIAELLNWMMRSLSDLPVPPGVKGFTAQEVAAYRSERLQDPAATRVRLLSTPLITHQ